MSGFTKLVPEIVQSSLWNLSSDIRIVWITMLAIKDEEGYVQGDERTIARMANVSIEAASEALRLFQLTDVNSNTPDNEGRRIEHHGGGWIVLNHHLYRTGDRKEYMRNYMRKKRKREKEENVNTVNINKVLTSASASASASESLEGSQEGRYILEDCLKASASIGMKREDVEAFYHHYAAVGWIDGAKRKITSIPSALAKWKASQLSHGKTYQPAVESTLVYCPVCNFDTKHCKCKKGPATR